RYPAVAGRTAGIAAGLTPRRAPLTHDERAAQPDVRTRRPELRFVRTRGNGVRAPRLVIVAQVRSRRDLERNDARLPRLHGQMVETTQIPVGSSLRPVRRAQIELDHFISRPPADVFHGQADAQA